MKMKTYTASNMADAMETIREELGDNAIIISSQKAPDGSWVRISAAIEDDNKTILSDDDFTKRSLAIRQALEYHNVFPTLKEKLLDISNNVISHTPTLSLSAAIEDVFKFTKIKKQSNNIIMPIGIAGAGKTSVVAKLAAIERLNKKNVNVITADAIKAGASEQLSAFTKILEIELKKVRGPKSLNNEMEKISNSLDFTIIDCPGINPFSSHDIEFIKQLKETSNADPIVVMPAGIDPFESIDIIQALSPIKAKKIIATKLDTSRRFGGILSAADAGDLAFCEVSISPHIADGFCSISPISLAKLILPENKRNISGNYM